jgi:hypothetical protein
MITVAATPATRREDHALVELVTNHFHLFEKMLKSGFTACREPDYSQYFSDTSLRHVMQEIKKNIHKKMEVVVNEKGPVEREETFFRLTYDRLDLGEGKTPYNLSGVIPDLVLKGIRKVHRTSSFRTEEAIIVFDKIPARLAPYVEYWIDKSMRGDLTNYSPRDIQANLKNIVQNGEKHNAYISRYIEDTVITAVCDMSGVIHNYSPLCIDYETRHENGFLLNIDSESIEQLIRGRYLIEPGPYVSPNINEFFVYVADTLKPVPCTRCADNYLEPFGYRLK